MSDCTQLKQKKMFEIPGQPANQFSYNLENRGFVPTVCRAPLFLQISQSNRIDPRYKGVINHYLHCFLFLLFQNEL